MQGLMKQRLVLLYLITAWPLVLLQIIVTPPFQVPDEPHHFMRALQIANGHVGGQRFSDDLAGGLIEADAQEVALAFKALAHDPGRRLQMSELMRVGALRWGESPKQPADFDNTAIYPPILYLPAAFALKIGQMLDLSILGSYYLARVVVGSLGVALAALALAMCRKGRTVLFVLLSFPFTLSAFASVSQDAMSIAVGAVAIAAISFHIDARREMSSRTRIGIALLLGAVVGSRLPLFPLMALPLLSAAGPEQRPFWRRFVEVCAGALPIVLALWCASVAKIAFRPRDGVSPPDQVAFLLHHPVAGIGILLTTLKLLAGAFFREIVTLFGWWDGMQPAWYYGLVAVALILCLILECLSASRGLDRRSALLVLALALAACAAVLLVMDIAWTPVGAPFIDGVQGRYFFLPVAACVLALPSWWSGHEAVARFRWTEAASLLVCAAVAGVNFWAVPVTILRRFYL